MLRWNLLAVGDACVGLRGAGCRFGRGAELTTGWLTEGQNTVTKGGSDSCLSR